MGTIFQVNEHDIPWTEYDDSPGGTGPVRIRVKALTRSDREIPPVQYVEYAPGHTDPVHSHGTDEFFIVTEGSIWLDDVESGAGSVVFVPRSTEYAVRGGRRRRALFPRRRPLSRRRDRPHAHFELTARPRACSNRPATSVQSMTFQMAAT